MKTKPFLLATAGSTVDGRTIDDKMLDQMASSYDPKTYGARVNIEHIRGISGDKPFRAYGDVLELATGEVTVNFNGKKEKRKGLFGVLDVTDDAKALNDASQKVYPSIEILPDFGGKGFAYLAGVALTDSPASIGTDRLQFNRQMPGAITLTAEASAIEAASIELAEEAKAADVAGAIDRGFATIAKLFGAKPKEPEAETPPPKGEQSFDATALLAGLKDVFTSALAEQSTSFETALSKLTSDLAALKTTVEATPNPAFTQRPLATGGAGQTKTDC